MISALFLKFDVKNRVKKIP